MLSRDDKIRRRLLEQTATLMQQREEASQVAVYEWLQQKRHQAQVCPTA